VTLSRSARLAAWIAMTVLACGIAVAASRYLFAGPEAFFPQQRAVYEAHLAPLLLHVGGGLAALLLGPWQFRSRLRARRPRLHRGLGRAYLLAVLAGGLGGLALAPLAYGGASARAGFGALAIFWLTTGALAFHAIRHRDVRRHRAWMIRCYALTFAAVTLRLWLPALQAAGLAFEAAYVTVAWLAWVPNLAAVEVALRLTSPREAVSGVGWRGAGVARSSRHGA
jgi:uncharacterized membrane protein